MILKRKRKRGRPRIKLTLKQRIKRMSLLFIFFINIGSHKEPIVILEEETNSSHIVDVNFSLPEPEKKLDDALLNAVMYVESHYSIDAVNRQENAVGILQIRPIMVYEVNRILTLCDIDHRFTLADRLDSIKSIQMWYIVQVYHNPQYDPMLAARIWNGGTKQYKRMSHQYWMRVKDQMGVTSSPGR